MLTSAGFDDDVFAMRLMDLRTCLFNLLLQVSADRKGQALPGLTRQGRLEILWSTLKSRDKAPRLDAENAGEVRHDVREEFCMRNCFYRITMRWNGESVYDISKDGSCMRVKFRIPRAKGPSASGKSSRTRKPRVSAKSSFRRTVAARRSDADWSGSKET